MRNYTKAITAFITTLISMVAIFGFDLGQYVGPELTSAIAIVGNTLLVYLLPNEPA
jgi:hypothetical protein